MADLQNVIVTRAIIHAVEPPAAPHLSTRLITLQGTPKADRIRKFLQAHVARTWVDSGSEAARFVDESPGSAFDHCQVMFSKPSEFVRRSRQLAQRLHDKMAPNSRITPGNLVVCECSEDGQAYIALLKLDVSSGIQRHIDGTEVELLEVPELLPDVARKLQKAAVIRVLGQPDYDLRLVDRQDGEVVAKFFRDGFLGVSIAYSPADLTKQLHDHTFSLTAQLQKKGQLSPREVEDVSVRLADTLEHTDELELASWVPQLPINPEARTQLGEALRKKMPQPSFPIDKTEAEKLRQHYYYLGEYGIKVQFSQEALDNGTVTRTVDSDGITTLTIRGNLTKVASPRARA